MTDLDKLLSIGKELGYQGESLQNFLTVQQTKDEEKRKEDEERDERARQREERALEREQERRKQDMEFKEKMKRLELEELDRKLQLGTDKKNGNGHVYAKVPKLPPFNEKDDLDSYLERFERYAGVQKWHRENWATNLSALLTGKALETYARLHPDEMENYDILKDALLKRYRLTEDGFRSRFYTSRAELGETAAQYVTRLQSYFERWMNLAGSKKTYEDTRDLLVRTHFIEACHTNLGMFLKERKPTSIKNLIDDADNYLQAHGGGLSELDGKKFQPKSSSDDTNQKKSGPTCHRCGKFGHIAPKCRTPMQQPFDPRVFSHQSSLQPANGGNLKPSFGDAKKCFLCGRIGHIAKNCHAFDKSVKHQSAVAVDAGIDANHTCPETVMPVTSSEESSKYACSQQQQHSACICQHQSCPCHMKHPVCFISGLKDVDESYNEGYFVDKGVKYPVCHMKCGKSVPGIYCHNLPTAEGLVNGKIIQVMRDSGCSGAVVKKQFVSDDQYTGKYRLCLMVDSTVRKVPVAEIEVDSPYYTGITEAMVMDTPVYDLILGNIPGVRDVGKPDPNWKPTKQQTTCAVTTRGQANRAKKDPKPLKVPEYIPSSKQIELADEQKADKGLAKIWKKVEDDTPRYTKTGETKFFMKNGILMRLYKSTFRNVHTSHKQIVLPEGRRMKCMKLAHEAILGGHMGVQKTIDRISKHFYWPGLHNDVARFCHSCDVCQRTVPKGKVFKVPLDELPTVDIPFKRIAVDIIGPIIPMSENGKQYILTIVDYATRYPEAIALSRIDTQTVAEAMLDVFSRVGFPEEILSDRGSQFTSSMMQEVTRLVSVRQLTTTPYHPMANGLVERFNGTLKLILKRLCSEKPRDWDRYLSAVLFAYREVPQESTRFSPFELLYGRNVRGPMDILKYLWTKEQTEEDTTVNSYQYVLELRDRIEKTCELARDELLKANQRYKRYYDRKTKPRQLQPGDKVLLLLPTDHNKLQLAWKGPFDVTQQIAKYDYSIDINGKPRTFHINMLKKYISRDSPDPKEDTHSCFTILDILCQAVIEEDDLDEDSLSELYSSTSNETYKDVHYAEDLSPDQRREAEALIYEYRDIFSDQPNLTTIEEHKIVLTTKEPVRQRPYPVPYAIRDTIREEIRKMLDANIIERTNSPYASPVVLVKKPDQTNRFCVDYRLLNKITVFDGEPMPNPADIFATLKSDVYFSKLDLAKGFWQIPMRDEDKPKTAFTTTEGCYQFNRMPFGLVNSVASFNRMMRKLLCGVPHADSFVDDVLSHTRTWKIQLETLRTLFELLRAAHLNLRPSKCFIGYKTLDFLGRKVGGDIFMPQDNKVEKIKNATRPATKKEVRSFLGLVSYYREFIPHFSSIASPLTDLTKKHEKHIVEWTDIHQHAFEELKQAIVKEPVLKVPDFERTFYLQIDASDAAAGAALLQEYDGIKHPVAYFSKKFCAREKNYSVIERECLALVWGIRRFQIYLYGVEFIIETDHQPLAFIDRAKMTNSRIMRWSLMLQNYRFRLHAVKGCDNVVADYLSRM